MRRVGHPTVLLALVLGLGLGPAAHAVKVEAADVPCPMGEGPVRVFRLLTQNTHGGWDSDGARYSTRGQFRTYAVSTCPENLLTLYGRDMMGPLDFEAQAALTPVLEALSAGIADPKALTSWERYLIAGRSYEAMGRDGLFVAKVYLEGSWTARDHGVGIYQGLDGPMAARTVLEAAPAELAKELEPAQERLLLLNLARVAHRGGYPTERDAYIEQLTGRTDLTEHDSEALDRLATAIEVEPTLQDLAIAALDTFLASDETAADRRIEATYLLAELHRRRGNTDTATVLFVTVKNDDAAPEQLRALAAYFGDELAGGRPWETMADTALMPVTGTPE